MARNKEEYDWLNDPFDEKKAAQEAQQAHMSSGSKLFVGCGCLVAVFGALALFLFGAVQLFITMG